MTAAPPTISAYNSGYGLSSSYYSAPKVAISSPAVSGIAVTPTISSYVSPVGYSTPTITKYASPAISTAHGSAYGSAYSNLQYTNGAAYYSQPKVLAAPITKYISPSISSLPACRFQLISLIVFINLKKIISFI